MDENNANPIPLNPEEAVDQFWNQVAAEFGLLTEAEVTQLFLKYNQPFTVEELRGYRQILEIERNGETLYPGYQFLNGAVRPVIVKLVLLGTEYGMSQPEVAVWMCSPTTYLNDGLRPVDFIDKPDLIDDAAERSWGVVWW
jgi:hypothetical protein